MNEDKKKYLTIDEIKEKCIKLSGNNNEEATLCMIREEFRQGIDMIRTFTPSVTFYGGARFSEDHPSYKQAQSLAYRISKELGYTVISGGGAGIMEAVSRGAHDAGGKVVGLTIKLPTEQATNKYVTDDIPFYFFFARKVSMSYSTEVCIFCPGGFGTLDELFDMLTLQQTNKIGKIPIILLGAEYWAPVEKIIKEVLIDKYKTVSPDDLNLYTITDDEDKILEIIKKSRLRTGEDGL